MAAAATDWLHFPCAGTPEARWRYRDDGTIEVEGLGVPTSTWTHALDKWHDHLTFFAAKYGVPAYQLAGIMGGECPSGDPNCCSPCALCQSMKNCGPCCAYGLMQLTLDTAQGLAKGLGLPAPSASDLFDPALNIELGAKYVSDLLKRYNGDFVSAAVGYNAGRVYCAPCKVAEFWGVCGELRGSYPLQAIKRANAAIANGFPLGQLPPISQPPLPLSQKFKPTISNFDVATATAVGSFIAFHLARNYFTPKRLRSLLG